MERTELLGYLGAREERIATGVREEMRAGDAAVREVEASLREAIKAIEASAAALREEMRAGNRAMRVLFESLEATIRAAWAEAVPALAAERDRRIEEQREQTAP